MEEPIVTCKEFGFVIKSWYRDADKKVCRTQSSYKTVARAMEICNGVMAGKIRAYNGFVIEECEFQGKKFVRQNKSHKNEEALDF